MSELTINPTTTTPTTTIIDQPILEYPTLLEYAAAILDSTDLSEKCRLTLQALELWNMNQLPLGNQENPPIAKDWPGRPPHLTVKPAEEVQSKVRGESIEIKQQRSIHAQIHIEGFAVDLSHDIYLRFANYRTLDGQLLPREFFDDWLKVAADEARHYTMWVNRLDELGGTYGEFPTHNELWSSAFDTRFDLLARLSVVHLVHESHGLDCGGRLINQFLGMRDKKSADMFRQIVLDEITHVAAGMRWYKHITNQIVDNDTKLYELDHTHEIFNPIKHFHFLVGKHFYGAPRPPFAADLRLQAGMTPEWYEPLAQIKKNGEKLNIRELMQQRKSKLADDALNAQLQHNNTNNNHDQQQTNSNNEEVNTTTNITE